MSSANTLPKQTFGLAALAGIALVAASVVGHGAA